jgi:hypothetical protein
MHQINRYVQYTYGLGCFFNQLNWNFNGTNLSCIVNLGASLESPKKQPYSYCLCFKLKFNVVHASKPQLYQQCLEKILALSSFCSQLNWNLNSANLSTQ